MSNWRNGGLVQAVGRSERERTVVAEPILRPGFSFTTVPMTAGRLRKWWGGVRVRLASDMLIAGSGRYAPGGWGPERGACSGQHQDAEREL